MSRASLIVGAIVFALLLAVPPLLKNYGVYLTTYWLVFVIATMGLNLTIGYAGQKSLGHAACPVTTPSRFGPRHWGHAVGSAAGVDASKHEIHVEASAIRFIGQLRRG